MTKRFLPSILLLLSAACETVEGAWEGDITCPGGMMALSMDLDADGANDFDGDGTIEAWTEDDYWRFSFDVDGEGAPRELVEEAVDLELKLTSCEEYELGPISSCPSTSFTFWWLEDDVIDGDLDFYGVDCSFELERGL